MKYPIISTRDLSLLPDVATLERVSRAMAVIWLIMHPKNDPVPWYSFREFWGPGLKRAHMNNEQGDHWHLLFNSHGVILLGFDHESEMSPYSNHGIWPGMYDGLPSEFQQALEEPAFEANEAVTYCIWRKNTDSSWHRGQIDFPFRTDDLLGYEFMKFPPYVADGLDGSANQLTLLLEDPHLFWEWLVDSYEDPESLEDIPIEAVNVIYAHEPLTQAMVETLKPGLKLESIRETLLETGYPLS